MLDPRAVARALGGDVSGCDVIAPGPGHSRADRSLSIKIDPNGPDGFLCHSFAGDDYRRCRDYVRYVLGLGACERRRAPPALCSLERPITRADHGATERAALALRLWNEADDPRNTPASAYLMSRGLMLGDDIAGNVIRFHRKLKFEGACVPTMLALRSLFRCR